jgi:hypothetical protein
MNSLRVSILPLFICCTTFAADIAPASDQYSREQRSTVVPPSGSAPVLFSRTVWPRVELSDGRVLERVRVSSEDGASVTLIHAGGIAKVDKRALPPELAAVHPYAGGSSRQPSPSVPATPAPPAPATPGTPNNEPGARRAVPVPTPGPMPGTSSAETQAEVLAAKIEVAVTQRARQYYEHEKRVGSGQTLSFGLMTDLSEPKEVPGWSHRWEVTGTAGYKVYDSVGWGSFSTRKSKFTAVVETPPGKRPVVVSFEER